MMEYAKDLMGIDGVTMAAHVVAHGMVVGGELEQEEPSDFLERLEIARTALVYALNLFDEMRKASADDRCRNAGIMCACKALAAALEAARQQMKWAEGQDREAVLELSIGSKEYTDRGFMSLTKSSATSVAWAAVGLGKDGGLRDFAGSVRDAVIVRGCRKAATALIRTMMGTVMLDEGHDRERTDVLAGRAEGLPGAVLQVTVRGSYKVAENLNKCWGALFGWPRPRASELEVSLGVQTEAPDDGYNVHKLFLADESQQLFKVMLLNEGSEAGLDEENIDQLSCGLKRLNLFGVYSCLHGASASCSMLPASSRWWRS